MLNGNLCKRVFSEERFAIAMFQIPVLIQVLADKLNRAGDHPAAA